MIFQFDFTFDFTVLVEFSSFCWLSSLVERGRVHINIVECKINILGQLHSSHRVHVRQRSIVHSVAEGWACTKADIKWKCKQREEKTNKKNEDKNWRLRREQNKLIQMATTWIMRIQTASRTNECKSVLKRTTWVLFRAFLSGDSDLLFFCHFFYSITLIRRINFHLFLDKEHIELSKLILFSTIIWRLGDHLFTDFFVSFFSNHFLGKRSLVV